MFCKWKTSLIVFVSSALCWIAVIWLDEIPFLEQEESSEGVQVTSAPTENPHDFELRAQHLNRNESSGGSQVSAPTETPHHFAQHLNRSESSGTSQVSAPTETPHHFESRAQHSCCLNRSVLPLFRETLAIARRRPSLTALNGSDHQVAFVFATTEENYEPISVFMEAIVARKLENADIILLVLEKKRRMTFTRRRDLFVESIPPLSFAGLGNFNMNLTNILRLLPLVSRIVKEYDEVVYNGSASYAINLTDEVPLLKPLGRATWMEQLKEVSSLPISYRLRVDNLRNATSLIASRLMKGSAPASSGSAAASIADSVQCFSTKFSHLGSNWMVPVDICNDERTRAPILPELLQYVNASVDFINREAHGNFSQQYHLRHRLLEKSPRSVRRVLVHWASKGYVESAYSVIFEARTIGEWDDDIVVITDKVAETEKQALKCLGADIIIYSKADFIKEFPWAKRNHWYFKLLPFLLNQLREYEVIQYLDLDTIITAPLVKRSIADFEEGVSLLMEDNSGNRSIINREYLHHIPNMTEFLEQFPGADQGGNGPNKSPSAGAFNTAALVSRLDSPEMLSERFKRILGLYASYFATGDQPVLMLAFWGKWRMRCSGGKWQTPYLDLFHLNLNPFVRCGSTWSTYVHTGGPKRPSISKSPYHAIDVFTRLLAAELLSCPTIKPKV